MTPPSGVSGSEGLATGNLVFSWGPPPWPPPTAQFSFTGTPGASPPVAAPGATTLYQYESVLLPVMDASDASLAFTYTPVEGKPTWPMAVYCYNLLGEYSARYELNASRTSAGYATMARPAWSGKALALTSITTFTAWEDANTPYDWTVDNTASGMAARDVAIRYSGESSLRYSNPDNATASGWHGLATDFGVPLSPGQQYRIVVASRCSTPSGTFRLGLEFNNAATLTDSRDFTYATADMWQSSEWVFAVPSGAETFSRLRIEFNRNGDANPQNFWIDSINVDRYYPTLPSLTEITTQRLNHWRFASDRAGADAGAKINAAALALPASGGTVIGDFSGAQAMAGNPMAGINYPVELILGAATYDLTAGIGLLSRLHLRGAGIGHTILRVPASGTGIYNASPSAAILFGSMRDLTIELTGDNAIGVDAGGLSRWEYRNVRIVGTGGTSGQIGIKCHMGDTVSSYSHLIDHCETNAVRGKGIEITDAGNNIRVVHCDILQGAYIGIDVDGTGGGFPNTTQIAFNRFDGADGGIGVRIGATGFADDTLMFSNRFEAVAGTWLPWSIQANARSTRRLHNWYTGGATPAGANNAGIRTYVDEPRPYGAGVNSFYTTVERQNFSLQNEDDAAGVFTIDSGSTAEQGSQINLADRATIRWIVAKLANQDFAVTDVQNGNFPRFAASPNGSTSVQSMNSNPVKLNVNLGTGLGTVFGDSNTNIVASVSAAGLGTFNGGVLAGNPVYPSATGLGLGTASLRWDAYLEDVDVYGRLRHAVNVVGYAASATFNAALGDIQKIILTGNVVQSTLSNAASGQHLTFMVGQDASGGRTFAWPSNVKGGMSIGTAASGWNAQDFVFDGTNAYAMGSGLADM